MSYLPDNEVRYGLSLFERLDTQVTAYSTLQGENFDDIITSVKNNLGNILNTRIGESLATPSLGLADFNDIALSRRDLALEIQQGICRCILTYEPRIAHVNVVFVPDSASPLMLEFHISATIRIGEFQRDMQLQLYFDQDRKYKVM